MSHGRRNSRLATFWVAHPSLVERTAWRTLTTEQQIEIGSRLSRFAGNTATLWHSAGDEEAETFAREIAASLNRAKWKVYSPASLWTMSGTTMPYGSAPALETGVSVSGPPGDAGHTVSDALIGELTNRGFDAIREPDSTRHDPDDPVFSIIVNARPDAPHGATKLRRQRTIPIQ